MAAESADIVIAKRLLDQAKLQGFQFQRVAEGPDGPLLGIRHTGDCTDTLYLGGFSRDCHALRERTTSLRVPDGALVERRVTGDALHVLNAVLIWGRYEPPPLSDCWQPQQAGPRPAADPSGPSPIARRTGKHRAANASASA